MNIIVVQNLSMHAGSTSLAASLAWSLGERNLKTLVIEATADDVGVSRLLGVGSIDEGWLTADMDPKQILSSVYRVSDNCFVIPSGTSNDSSHLSLDDQSLRLRISFLLEAIRLVKSKFDYVVIEVGQRSSPVSQSLVAVANVCLTMFEPDGCNLVKLNTLTPKENEFFCLSKCDSRSATMANVATLIRNSNLADKILPSGILFDEFAAEAFLHLLPVTKYASFSSYASSVERIMTEIIFYTTKNKVNDNLSKNSANTMNANTMNASMLTSSKTEVNMDSSVARYNDKELNHGQ